LDIVCGGSGIEAVVVVVVVDKDGDVKGDVE
jgi:hypothetical protein